MRFTKAHGLGNDFVLVAEEAAPADLSAWAVRLCDRHRGIGGDGVVLHARTPDGVSFRLVNADGLVGEISGNGLRCLAALAVRSRWAPPRHVVRTVVGPKAVEVSEIGPSLYRIVTNLGPPGLGSRDAGGSRPAGPDGDRPPLEAAGRRVSVTATSMGNPHCAVFLDEPADDALVASLGPALEFHPFFPRRTNVEFITVVSPSEIRVRFWERGVGYTMASGTGSASAAVASIIAGRTGRSVKAVCDGGVLDIEWPEAAAPPDRHEILYEGDGCPDPRVSAGRSEPLGKALQNAGLPGGPSRTEAARHRSDGTAQIHPRFARVGRRAGSQFSAVGTASEKGAISASKAEPPAVTIW
jgi:diaminopimelate epimerase